MTSRLVESIVTAGLGCDIRVEGMKKNLLCGILDLTLLRGDPEPLKQRIAAQDGEANLKWVRFMALSTQLNVWLCIRYSHPFRNTETLAVFDIEVVRTPVDMPLSTVTPHKGQLILTVNEEIVNSIEELFTLGKVQNINDLFPSVVANLYLAKDRRIGPGDPLNELHLHPLPSNSLSIKFPPGYRMASSTLLEVDGSNTYLVKRSRPPAETVRYKADILSLYPTLSEGACHNCVRMLFPEGLELSSTQKKPTLQSCYIAVNEGSLDKHMLTFVRFFEPLDKEATLAFNLSNFRDWLHVYQEKALGLISKFHDNYSAEKILKYLYEYILADVVELPIERVICNLADELYIRQDRPTIFTPLKFSIGPDSSPKKGPALNYLTSKTTLLSSVRIPSLPVISLKRLFRVLSLESVLLVFKSLLLERGVYLIGRNPRTAFDIIEAVSSLIYPLKWELPKILSYEANYSFFESPIPMIYFFSMDKFKFDRIAHIDMGEKTIVYVDSNDVKEYAQEPGLTEFPHKLLEKLMKGLEKTIGVYNLDYLAKKGDLSKEQFEKLLEKEEDAIPFDYWRVRELFFEFMNELMDNYRDCYKESIVLESKDMGSASLFDFNKFLKAKASLKHKTFPQTFMKTSIFSRFVECRIQPESTSQEIYFNYFDSISHEKWENPKAELLRTCILKAEVRAPLECLPPNSEGIDIDEVFSYKGIVPLFSPELFCPPRSILNCTEGTAIDEFCDFLDQTWVMKCENEKWARCNLEIIFTVWLISLRVWTSHGVYPGTVELMSFAYNKLFELEEEKVNPNAESLKSMAYLLGVFGEQNKFQRIYRKHSKVLEAHGQTLATMAEYVKGFGVKKMAVDPSVKHIKYSGSNKKGEYTTTELSGLEVKEADEEKRDSMIPVGVKAYFETNAFCSKCATYIPEEIIIARMLRDPAQTRAVCPNQACHFEYEPVFSCVFLKEKGCTKMQDAVKLHSPLRLFILLKEFLEINDSGDLFSPSISGDLYWNLLFYANFLNLPSFFMEKESDPHLEEFSLKTLHSFTFEETKNKKAVSKKTTLGATNLSGNDSYSFGESHNVSLSASVSSASPDKKNRSSNAALSNETQAHTPKFIFKKDLYVLS